MWLYKKSVTKLCLKSNSKVDTHIYTPSPHHLCHHLSLNVSWVNDTVWLYPRSEWWLLRYCWLLLLSVIAGQRITLCCSHKFIHAWPTFDQSPLRNRPSFHLQWARITMGGSISEKKQFGAWIPWCILIIWALSQTQCSSQCVVQTLFR